MQFVKLILSIFCIVNLLSSCAVRRQRQVWLGALQRTHNSDTNIVRIYFDKNGDIYPSSKFYIPYKSFFDPKSASNTYKESLNSGNLFSYYKTNQTNFNPLCSYYGLTKPYKNYADSFINLQTNIIVDNTNRINQKLKISKGKTLIVLIHGFNDPDPTGDFQQLRDSIRKLKDAENDFVYLEVYWDGLSCNQANPAFSKIWGKAQANSARVSIGMRKVFARVNQTTKIRVITHSMGAGVITGALFNTKKKWHGSSPANYDMTEAPLQKDFRFGMIAPAIPGMNTFTDFEYRGSKTITPSENNITRIVVGYNKNDYALTKLIRVSGKLGSTSLGCDRKGQEISGSRDTLINFFKSATTVDEIFRKVDFTKYDCKKAEEHGLYYYMLNGEKLKSFLDNLFD